MTSQKHLWGLVLVLLVSVLVFCLLPLGTAFEMGGDEGFEVIKGFMCSKGYKLYTEIWNDQPPVSTVLLSTAFKLWGPSILTARLVAAGFGLLMIGVFHELVRQRSGQWTALAATFLFFASPGVLMMSVSMMLEGPAFATALLAAWLLFQWGRRRHWAWLLLSGAAMAIALQIKLTAALAAPAMMVELLLICRARNPQPSSRGRVLAVSVNPTRRGVDTRTQSSGVGTRSSGVIGTSSRRLLWGPEIGRILCWTLTLMAVFTLIGLTWGKGALASSWKSHTGVLDVPGLDRPQDHKFDPRLLWTHNEAVLATLVCLIAAARQKRLCEVAFPLVLLLTVSAVHVLHRPWWNYYYLHFDIPLAWLAGWGLKEATELILRLQAKQKFNLGSRATWKLIALCVLAAFVMARSERRLEGAIMDLRQRPAADANPIVAKMKDYANRTTWVYSEAGIYPFHARLRVIPELAIVMPKRFWSGQISTAAITNTCRRYHAELLILPVEAVSKEWKSLLESEYDFASADKRSLLYVAKRLQSN